MSVSNLNKVRVVIADPRLKSRQQIVQFLKEKGMHIVMSTGNFLEAEKDIEAGDVDLLILNASLPEGDVTALISDIRHGKVGSNPFIVIIVITPDMMPDSLKALVNSGADDILTIPFTPEKLLKRLSKVSLLRKKFIASLDYIGPNRRTKRRPNDSGDLAIRVPNPLVEGGFSGMDQDVLRGAITRSTIRLNEQRLENTSRKIVYLTARVADGIEGENYIDELSENIDELLFAAVDMCSRLKGTQYSLAADKAQTMVSMLEDLKRSKKKNDKHLAFLLMKLSEVIMREFTHDNEEDNSEKKKVDHFFSKFG